ncbi:MAG: RecX family transcriptional regulator [Acidobacteria bacterium]|jgi:SOS response regulatory protein OraA/RecX|nr:RecX family transcriptional regulator [Acidobacteriota bacterium]
MSPAKPSAYDRAVAALARRALSVSELRRRLARAGHPREEIEAAIRRLTELKLVDDRSVAYNHARSRAAAGRKGPARVRAELAARGIRGGDAEQAVDAAFTAEDVAAAAARAFERHARGMARPLAAPDRVRVAARLARAGFPAALIRSLLAAEREAAADDGTAAGAAGDELLLDDLGAEPGEDEPGVPRDAED